MKHFYASVQLTTGQLAILLFANDLVKMVESEKTSSITYRGWMIHWRSGEWKHTGRKIKVMRIRRKQEACNVKVIDESVEQVKEMKYLSFFV